MVVTVIALIMIALKGTILDSKFWIFNDTHDSNSNSINNDCIERHNSRF